MTVPSTDIQRVLLVENNPIVGRILQHALEDAGYEPAVATTFLEGTKLLATKRWHLIVVNADLPRGSGLALAETAQQLNTKALVMTDSPKLVPLLTARRIAHLRMPAPLKSIVNHIKLMCVPNHLETKFVIDYSFDLSHQRIVKSRLRFHPKRGLKGERMGTATGKRAAPDPIFASAYLAAVAAVGEARWSRLPISGQRDLIYREMRRIDAENVKGRAIGHPTTTGNTGTVAQRRSSREGPRPNGRQWRSRHKQQ